MEIQSKLSYTYRANKCRSTLGQLITLGSEVNSWDRENNELVKNQELM